MDQFAVSVLVSFVVVGLTTGIYWPSIISGESTHFSFLSPSCKLTGFLPLSCRVGYILAASSQAPRHNVTTRAHVCPCQCDRQAFFLCHFFALASAVTGRTLEGFRPPPHILHRASHILARVINSDIVRGDVIKLDAARGRGCRGHERAESFEMCQRPRWDQHIVSVHATRIASMMVTNS